MLSRQQDAVVPVGAAKLLHGHMRIRELLQRERFSRTFERAELLAQFSSLGSLNDKWLHEEFVGSLSAGKCPGAPPRPGTLEAGGLAAATACKPHVSAETVQLAGRAGHMLLWLIRRSVAAGAAGWRLLLAEQEQTPLQAAVALATCSAAPVPDAFGNMQVS